MFTTIPPNTKTGTVVITCIEIAVGISLNIDPIVAPKPKPLIQSKKVTPKQDKNGFH